MDYASSGLNIDLSFVDQNFECHHPNCIVLTSHYWSLPCGHSLCIQHIKEHKKCPSCLRYFDLACLPLPETLPHQDLIKHIVQRNRISPPPSPPRAKIELQTAQRINIENKNTILKLRQRIAQLSTMQEMLLSRLERYEHLFDKRNAPIERATLSGRESPPVPIMDG